MSGERIRGVGSYRMSPQELKALLEASEGSYHHVVESTEPKTSPEINTVAKGCGFVVYTLIKYSPRILEFFLVCYIAWRVS